MYKCECGKEFGNSQSHNAHKSHCGKNKKTVKHRFGTSCPYCDKEFDTPYALGGHARWCEKNPNDKDKIRKILSEAKKGFRHTEETKQKLREKQYKILEERPELVPYRMAHSSKMSYAEKVFMNALKSSGITGWVYNYYHGIYAYDFAFPELKVDVEVDGKTHLQEDVVAKDKRRDEWSKSKGWKVIRFTGSEVKDDVIKCINRVRGVIGNVPVS